MDTKGQTVVMDAVVWTLKDRDGSSGVDTKGQTAVMDAVVWTLKDRGWLWTQWCGH